MFKPFDNLDKKCKVPIEEFKRWIICDQVSDDDGFGLYATDTQVSNIYADLNDIYHDHYPLWVTNVCWYNK